jgi:Spy/CpxP family protein refolding chaperone
MKSKWMMPLVLGLLAGPVMAQQEQPPPQQPQPARMRMGPLALGPGLVVGMYAPQHLVNRREALALTPEQVARLEALAQEAKQADDKAQAEAKTHWDQLAEVWKQPTPDVNQVRTHAQAAMQAMQGARLSHLVTAAQAKAVLTAEQRGRVAGWADGGRMRMQQRMNRPGRPAPMMRPMRMRRGIPPEPASDR